MRAVYLTSPELAAAVQQLEGERLPLRTLAAWAASSVLVPSIDWARKRRATRLYSLRDLARARLIVRLRRRRIGLGRVRLILMHLEQYERDVFRAGTNAVLKVDGWRAEIVLQRPGEAARSLPSGQLLLPLADVTAGNRQTAESVRGVA